MSLPQKFHNGELYHYASEEIRCNADKEGAQVFEVKVGGSAFLGIPFMEFLILSHDEQLAVNTARENHPDYCDSCGKIPCGCPSDDEF